LKTDLPMHYRPAFVHSKSAIRPRRWRGRV